MLNSKEIMYKIKLIYKYLIFFFISRTFQMISRNTVLFHMDYLNCIIHLSPYFNSYTPKNSSVTLNSDILFLNNRKHLKHLKQNYYKQERKNIIHIQQHDPLSKSVKIIKDHPQSNIIKMCM